MPLEFSDLVMKLPETLDKDSNGWENNVLEININHINLSRSGVCIYYSYGQHSLKTKKFLVRLYNIISFQT